LILPSPSKLRHDFPQVISKKKVASLLYPSLSFKVSCLVLTFDLYLFKKKKKQTWVQLYKKEYKFSVNYFYAIQFFSTMWF
jgi:hypothetical protein